MDCITLKDPFPKEYYVIGKKTNMSYGWMSYLNYRKGLENGRFDQEDNEILIEQVCIQGIDERGFKRETDMTLRKAWDCFYGCMLAVVDLPLERLEELGWWDK